MDEVLCRVLSLYVRGGRDVGIVGEAVGEGGGVVCWGKKWEWLL